MIRLKAEFEPETFNRFLLSSGLSEQQVRILELEFTKNNNEISDETLLDYFLKFGLDIPKIIFLFNRIGIGKNTMMAILEMRQKKKLGKLVEIYHLEVVK